MVDGGPVKRGRGRPPLAPHGEARKPVIRRMVTDARPSDPRSARRRPGQFLDDLRKVQRVLWRELREQLAKPGSHKDAETIRKLCDSLAKVLEKIGPYELPKFGTIATTASGNPDAPLDITKLKDEQLLQLIDRLGGIPDPVDPNSPIEGIDPEPAEDPEQELLPARRR